jgi:hypothetical protein
VEPKEFGMVMDTVSEFGHRLERIEALLFLSNFEHFQEPVDGQNLAPLWEYSIV